MTPKGELSITDKYPLLDPNSNLDVCLWQMDTVIGKACSTDDRLVHFGGQAILQNYGNSLYLSISPAVNGEDTSVLMPMSSTIRIEQDALEFAHVDTAVI